tara:strand:+ start:3043 stop:3348 length:306 start_codon:yes stop_codon:yes gene_type:complete
MNNLITTCKTIAFLSFIIGTILFAFQLYFKESDAFIFPGIIFISFAIIINTISLLILIIIQLSNSEYRLELLKTCGIILLNIPIAILYFYILISIEFPEKG